MKLLQWIVLKNIHGIEIIKANEIGDPCFEGMGWNKIDQKVNDINVHFMAKHNKGKMTEVTDFKFKVNNPKMKYMLKGN